MIDNNTHLMTDGNNKSTSCLFLEIPTIAQGDAGGNVGVEGNNMLLVDLVILFRTFGFLAP